MNGRDDPNLPPAESLTPREQEILNCIGDDMSNRQIAEQQTIALSTVKWYLRQIYKKLGVSSRGEAVVRAQSLGLLKMAVPERTVKNNLPTAVTPFVGREHELTAIAAKLSDPNCRQLTILAAGGMGKTRLSIEAAGAQLPCFADGVTYVEMAPAGDDGSDKSPNPLAAALADVLDFPFHGGDTPEHQLFSYLQHKEMLLVLDNFEHLLTTAEFVSQLLQNAPDLKIIVTSRERLNLQEEWLFPLHGLSFQESDRSDAVELFTQRARQTKASFNLAAELPAVLKICRQVEGMPLGLELAAAWVLHLSCAEIADEINSKIDFLATEMRNVPDRHRSVRAVFGYSWERITISEQDILQKLSVFRGGFDRSAAEAVAGASLRTLSQLVNKSLLSIGDNGRYTIHELLRQFVAEKLAKSGSLAPAVRESHGRYFLTFVSNHDVKLHGPEMIEALAALTQDIDNVRAAIRWAIHHQPHLFDTAIRSALSRFFEIKGWFLEAESTFKLIIDQLRPDSHDQPLSQCGEVPQNCARLIAYQLGLSQFQTRLYRLQEAQESAQLALTWAPLSEKPSAQQLRASVIDQLGSISFIQGAYTHALDQLQQAEALYLAEGGGIDYGALLFTRCLILQHTGAYDAAEEALHSAGQIAAQFNFPFYFLSKWTELGKLAMVRGQLDEAEAYFDQGLLVLAKINQRPMIAYVLRERGEVARLKGEFALAKTYTQRSIAVAEEINTLHPVMFCYWSLGNLAVDEEKYETALRYFAEFEQASIAKQEHIGGPGWAMLGLGRLAKARHYFAASLHKMLGSQTRPIGLDALVGMANIKAGSGQFEEALALLTLVNNHPSSHFESRQKAHKLWQELVIEIPAELIAAAETRGREMDLWQTAESLLAEAED